MDYSYLFEPYSELVTRADKAFETIAGQYPESIKCRPGCSDCCHAVFGLFPVEAVFLKHDFDQLNEDQRQAALIRAQAADKEIAQLEKTLANFEGDTHMQNYSVAKARVRCPLLTDKNECIMYEYRPITCRTYGIPTMIQGQMKVCGKAGFQKGKSYPAFNISVLHRELYELSKELIKRAEMEDMEIAGLLISVSKIIQTPVEELFKEVIS